MIPDRWRMADGERIEVGPSSLPLPAVHFSWAAARTPGDTFWPNVQAMLTSSFPPRLCPQQCPDPCLFRPRTTVLVRRILHLAEVSKCRLLPLPHIGKDDGASRPLLKHWLRFLHNWHLLIASPPLESPWCLTKCCTDSKGRSMLSTRFSEPFLVTNVFAI